MVSAVDAHRAAISRQWQRALPWPDSHRSTRLPRFSPEATFTDSRGATV